jgi:hypothetical protein
MAVPADTKIRLNDREGMGGELTTLRAEYNKLITQFRALCAKCDVLTAKLNADAGVTDVNYATDFAATLANADAASPAKIVTI